MPRRAAQILHFHRFRLDLLLPATAILVGALGLWLFAPAQPPLAGRATVVDGDTLRLGGGRIRLLGIDAPELEQTCTTAAGADWPCGMAARQKLVTLVGDGEIVCAPRGRDRYARPLAHCTAGGIDLGGAIVGAGLAVAEGEYFAEQGAAQAAKSGIWEGSFMLPAEWRRRHGGDTFGQNWITAIRDWFR